ncbi:MAG TPA: hypothetical protein VNY52_01785 [Solirubrobacteraceae bacterium]|nr:hypothetical protein [Solirubrobacteraceae bacterium]
MRRRQLPRRAIAQKPIANHPTGTTPPQPIANHPTQAVRPPTDATRLLPGVACLLAAALLLLASGCATSQPPPISLRELAQAQTFPYYPLYWVGPTFGSYTLAAADGRYNYISTIGDSVYYGNCVSGKTTALGGGGCQLPVQVTTLIYARHANAPLGTQRNTVLRGVPAVIYDGGHTIELYSGRTAIDVFSDDLSEALRAVRALRPLNAPGSAAEPLPPPVFCPGLSGPRPAAVQSVLRDLPGRPCQKLARTLAIDRALFGKG